MTNAVIQQASPDDLAGIESWLRDEYEQAGTGEGFWNNVSILREAARDARLMVLRIPDTELPVAFCSYARRFSSLDILEVHPGHRRQGHGRALSRHCIERVRQAGVEEMVLLCEPKTSVPFWEAEGFEHIDATFDPIQMRKVLS